MGKLQFPWRWLDVATPCLALACGSLGAGFGPPRVRRALTSAFASAALFVFYLNALPYFYPPRWQDLPTQPTLADLTAVQRQWGAPGLSSWGEYAARTVTYWPVAHRVPGGDQGLGLHLKLREDQLPAGAVLRSEGGPLAAELELRLPAAAPLVFDTFYFPGWQAEIDGQPAALGPDEAGHLRVVVPTGEHTVRVFFGRTPIRAATDALSALTLALVALALILPVRSWVNGAAPLAQAGEPEAAASLVGPALAVILLGLALLKVAWLDRFDSRFVVHPRGGAVAGLRQPDSQNFGGELSLLGYQLVRPERLDLIWEAQKPPARDYTIVVTLADGRGHLVAEVRHTHPGLGLTSRWAAGDVVRDEYALPLDPSQRPIGYRLSVSVIDPLTNEALPVVDAPEPGTYAAAVGTTKLDPAASAPPGQVVEAVFADALRLQSAEVPDEVQAGGVLSYTLVWQSLAPLPVDYTVYVHLLYPDGTLAAAADGPPRQGLYPTSFWSPGEVIVDARRWPVAVPPGEYRLQVGWYGLETGERLSLTSGPGAPGDGVALKNLRVVP